MKKIVFGMCVVSTMLNISSCSTENVENEDPTANLPVCDCVELEPKLDGNGERIKGREHIMYLKDSLYTGKCVTYHLDNSTKKTELIFQKGLMNGLQQVWDEKGNKILEAPMSQGQFHGTLKEWDDKKHLISKMEFEGNKIVGSGYNCPRYLKKDNKKIFTIYSVNEPRNLGFYYPGFFEDDEIEDLVGWTFRMTSTFSDKGNGYIEILANWNNDTRSYDSYNIKKAGTKFDQNNKNALFEILNEFHKNNPDETWNIGGYHESLRGSAWVWSGELSGDFENLSSDFLDICNSLKSFKFLQFHPALNNL